MTIIKRVNGDILETDCKMLVCPVNCVGVMGAGLAKGVKDRWPMTFKYYRQLYLEGRLAVDQLWVHKGDQSPRVVLFPTKIHWRHPSQLEWVDANLQTLAERCRAHSIESVAIPPVGCGLGGLTFEEQVYPLIEQYFADHPTAAVVYLP